MRNFSFQPNGDLKPYFCSMPPECSHGGNPAQLLPQFVLLKKCCGIIGLDECCIDRLSRHHLPGPMQRCVILRRVLEYSGAVSAFRAQRAFHFGPKRRTTCPTERENDSRVSSRYRFAGDARFDDFIVWESSPAKRPPIADIPVGYFKNRERSVEERSKDKGNKNNQMCPTESAGHHSA